MKPRLDSAEFTEDDKVVWLRMCYYEPWDHLAFAAAYALGDRRDADMMHMLEAMRVAMSVFEPKDYPRCMVHAIMLGSEQKTGQVCFP